MHGIYKRITFVIQNKYMNVLLVIYHICTNPHITNIVIKDGDDRTPLQAIEYLSTDAAFNGNSEKWNINTSLEKNTMLIWQ